MTFTHYTDYMTPSSKAVEHAYFNANDNALVVVVDGGSTYEYSNVTPDAWVKFKNAFSKGRHYAKVIKREYGPSEYLGFNADESFEESSEPVKVEVSANRDGVGTPKGLAFAPGAVVTTTASSLHLVSLGTATASTASAGISRKHAVLFSVHGQHHTYNVDAVSVDKAVEALTEATDALGLIVVVKEVTVYFE